MKLLNKLERRFGRYAIPNLMKYIVMLFFIGLALGAVPNLNLWSWLWLDFDLVLKGQVWRLITGIIPISSLNGIILTAISVYIYYIFGNDLENAWGSFRFNLYVFSGVLFNYLAAFIVYLITGTSYFSPSIATVCGTMFFAFAAIYPNASIMLYFLIPIKAKYIAWVQAGYYIVQVIGYILGGNFILIIPLVASMANFLIFFFATRNYHKISPSEYKRKATYRRQMKAGKTGNVTQFRGKNVITRHKCAVCGRTELDNDQLEFRFCSKCEGNYEYCMDHLFTHEHVH